MVSNNINHIGSYVNGSIFEFVDFAAYANHEAVTMMILLQILSISVIILKFSSVANLFIWFSFSFLIYEIAGPHLLLKWFLIVASFIWHTVLLFWTYPWLLACGFIMYGFLKVKSYLSQYHDNQHEVENNNDLAERLEVIEQLNQELLKKLDLMTDAMTQLKDRHACCSADDAEDDWTSNANATYPLDRKRSMSLKEKNMQLEYRRKLRSSKQKEQGTT